VATDGERAAASPVSGFAPAPLAPAAPLPVPADKPYPGVIALVVDATDTDHRVLHMKETLPVQKAGDMILVYPKWLPGNHSTTGPISNFTGLTVQANGQTLAWRRDPVEMYAFHVTVPEGAATLDISYDVITPFDPRDGRVVMTSALLDLQWNMTALYPAGYFSRQIPYSVRLSLPPGWKYATALETAKASAEAIDFKITDLDTLVDSPLYAGAYAAQFDLDPGGPAPVRLNVFADKVDALNARLDQISAHRNLVKEAYKLYGSRHFDHYDFLLSLSEQLSPIGLEHHRSSEDGVPLGYFSDWEKLFEDRDLLPHEFTHSWNGKFRRPADLWTPTYDTPMRDSLLWVYEGQTEYWGEVLAARSGLKTRQQSLDSFAAYAALYDNRTGRRWRPLQDTTNDPIISYRGARIWPNWQRTTDYYREGAMIWLDVDTQIREMSKGQKSLDDFARSFFGVGNGEWTPRTYVFDDVVKALNAISPYDWASFLRTRLDRSGPGAGAPMDGLVRGGYRLVYGETPTDSFRLDEARHKACDLSYSLGFSLDQKGQVRDVIWEGVAFKAGIAPGATVLAVNGVAFDPDGLKEAVRAAKSTTMPIELIVRSGEQYRILKIDYHGGLRYPRLERDPSIPARLDDILAPKARHGAANGAGDKAG
jgi:predicted metalloprotease with PDZ domain